MINLGKYLTFILTKNRLPLILDNKEDGTQKCLISLLCNMYLITKEIIIRLITAKNTCFKKTLYKIRKELLFRLGYNQGLVLPSLIHMDLILFGKQFFKIYKKFVLSFFLSNLKML